LLRKYIWSTQGYYNVQDLIKVARCSRPICDCELSHRSTRKKQPYINPQGFPFLTSLQISFFFQHIFTNDNRMQNKGLSACRPSLLALPRALAGIVNTPQLPHIAHHSSTSATVLDEEPTERWDSPGRYSSERGAGPSGREPL
jgi:hypothetical protein